MTAFLADSSSGSVILSKANAERLVHTGQRPFALLRVTRETARRIDWLAVALAVAAFAVYARTLAPSVLWSDYGEYQYSAYSLSVPHQTGYPLYILLAKLWTLLPVGDVAYRVNLMSAFWGAVTVALTYLCVKQLCGSRLAAALSALTLAFSAAFWTYACIAAIRTLHTTFVALVTLLTLGVAQRRASVEALALAIGLAMTHHRMTLFLLPGVAWVIWQMRAQVAWSVRRLFNAAMLLAIPQLLYLFVALGRSWSSPREFWDFVLATNEASVLSKTWGQIAEQFVQKALPTVWNVFTPVGLLIALLGLGALILSRRDVTRQSGHVSLEGQLSLRGAQRRSNLDRADEIASPPATGGAARNDRDDVRQSIGVYLAGGWLINIAFAGLHFTEDPTHYLTHGFILQAIALGAGLAAAVGWLEHKLPKRAMRLALMLPVTWAAMNWQAADQSGTGWIGPFTLDEMASVESNSLIMTDWSFVMPYRYHQVVEGHRRDLTLVLLGDTAAMSRVEPDVKSGRPVYLRERYVGKQWKGQFPFIPVGRLWRVLPAEPTFSDLQRVNESFGDDLKLTQVAVWPAKLTADQLMLLRLRWELARPIEHDLSVSIRLVDADGAMWMHQETPLQDSTGVLSATAWALGPAFPPGEYYWQITVDDQSAGANLGLSDLPPFRIERPDHSAPLSSLVLEGRPAAQPGLDGWELVGYASVVRNAQPGALVTASLFWRATRDVAGPAEARLQLRDRQGSIIAEQSVALPREARAGDLVESRPGLALPVRLADGRYDYFVVGSNAVSLGALEARGRARNYTVPSVAHRRQVQLGDSIELLGYDLSAEKMRPGEQVNLKLIWRAKKPVSQSFKVFAHVVDANGKLLVQKDGVPGNWSLPTDTWVAGEVVVDSYVIPIPPEAAPGNYRVQIGMYNPESGQRLPALEAGSRLADDSIPLSIIVVR